MNQLDADVEMLEDAIRMFVQTIKRPQRWARITAQAGINLDRPSAIILHLLVAHEPKQLRVQDLAREIGIEPPSVTRKTQLLEELGYIERLADTQDKRAVSLKVTPAGHKISKKLRQAQRENMAKVLDKWPAAERQQLAKLLERFSNELNAAG